MRLSPRLAAGCLALAVAAALCGCGGGKDEKLVTVKGKLVKGGQPFQAQLTGPKMPTGDGVGLAEVVLYPVKDDRQKLVDDNGDPTVPGAIIARVEPDGTFQVGGAKEKGLAPGKYRFVVKQIDPLTDKDRLGNKYDERNSRITRDVAPDQEIVIDLAKPTG